MKSTVEEAGRRKTGLAAVPIKFALYLFSAEEVTEQERNRNAAQPPQWLCQHKGKIKLVFWYILSVLLSMGISNLH